MLVRIWRNLNPQTATRNIRWWSCFGKQSTVPQVIKHSYIPSCISKWSEKICPYKILYMNVYSNIAHNSPNMKMTQIFIKGWISWQYVVYTHNKMLFNHKKEGNSFFIWPCLRACDILILLAGVEPVPPAVERQSEPLDHQWSPKGMEFWYML